MSTATLMLPPIAVLASAAADLVLQAADAQNIGAVNALNKAALALHEGVSITPTAGGFLIPSATRNTVHRVSTLYGCGCEAGRSGKACWHAALISIVIEAQAHAIPMGDRIAAARFVAQAKAAREMAELFN